MHPAWAPNQPHRGEFVKLLVHPAWQKQGMGTKHMQAVERTAKEACFRLLTLDAKRGSNADRLYHKLGWTSVGTIPAFAFDTDGLTPNDAVIYYKNLADE